jgi:translation initiation factor 2B subunit (eIF-2B alpha/beta/delta family)/8-oxo-dGTP pyrophosphatase MutT (NUDIX family)
MDERAVVTGFLRHGSDVLLLRRSDAVGSYRGRWGGVAGHVEDHESPDDAVRAEIREETGIDPDTCALVRRGEPFFVADADLGVRWQVHPSLFDCPTRTVELNEEHTDFEWVSPTEIYRRPTVRNLDESYDRVRPTVETVREDHEHGSASLSVRGLEVLRDEAALLATDNDLARYDDVTAVAGELVDARPSMVVLGNRLAQVLDAAGTDPETVERAALAAIDRARLADGRAAEKLQSRVDGARVATLSRSGTVEMALSNGDPAAVLLPESRPGREGVGVAEDLAAETAVTLTSDAAFPGQLESWTADLLVVGADAVLPDGAVRNKVGTRPAAAVAATLDIPVLVATAVDKIAPTTREETEPRPGEHLYDGSAPLAVANTTFEHTPATLVDEYVTDRGALTADEIETLATEFAEYRQALDAD